MFVVGSLFTQVVISGQGDRAAWVWQGVLNIDQTKFNKWFELNSTDLPPLAICEMTDLMTFQKFLKLEFRIEC